MLRLVLRPLLVIVTLGALLVALLQVAGRVTFHFLDRLEPVANRVLADRGIHVVGLSGGWRMLDPVIRIDRIDLPAGHLQDVVLEVDALESVLRGTLLARRLRVAEVELTVEKRSGAPWRLRGASGANDFDPLPFLQQSNQLEMAGRLVFDREGLPSAGIRFEYLGVNRGGEHRHSLALRNEVGDCRAATCVLYADFQRQDRLWPLRPGRARITASTETFLLPKPLLGISPLQIAGLDLAWQRNGAQSGGTLGLRAEQFDMPGDVTLALELEGSVRGRDGVDSGAVSDWRIEQGNAIWKLPPVAVAADADAVSLWMPTLDLARAAAFLRQALAAVGPARRWLDALDLRGSAHDVHVSYGLDGTGLSYGLSLDEVALDSFKGVPSVRHAGGELFGYERGLELDLNAQDVDLAFPDVFTDAWKLPYAQGVLQAWFGPDYFGVRGSNLRAETGGTRAAGSFAVTRPQDREGQRLALLVSTERMPVKQAQQFVPYKLPEHLKDWLLTAPDGGALEHARLAFQGQFQEEPGELGRRIELTGRLSGGAVRYHPDWPEVTGLSGLLTVAGPLVEVEVERGESGGAKIGGSRVRVVDNASAADISLDAEARAGSVLDFLRTTPLARWLSFIEPDWQADGPMRLSGELHVPLNGTGEAAEPSVRLRGDLHGVDVQMPGYRVALDALEGSFRYRYPYQVDASGVTGRMFDAPVRLAAGTEDDRVHLRFDGRARPEDVWHIIDMEDPGVASGTFDFEADLGLGVANAAVSELTVHSTLEGTVVNLPAGYGKVADTPAPSEVELTFLPEYKSVHLHYRDAVGWLHFDQAPLAAAIGFDSPPSPEDRVTDSLVLGGYVDRFELEDVIPEGDGAGSLPLPIRLDGLSVGEIGLGSFAITRATLDGLITDDGLALTVDSAEVSGALERSGADPMKVSFSQVTVPAGDGGGDPIGTEIIPRLPAADVDIAQLTRGDEDFGSWHFELRPTGQDLAVHDLHASVRGVTIDSPQGLVWRASDDRTRFEGSLAAGDLAEVLPQWGYAPSVETESASLVGAFTWPGSPLMVDLLTLQGDAHVRAHQGRFLDVESGAGALKIFSLLNFSAIAKRMALNFSDVFGRGVSFDDLKARFSLDDGQLAFLEPMKVDGTGSEFRITGSVDLAARRLDNEMIVTLPVSKSLPWYAAWVALANPLAGLGVLVGERVLRKPLEQFSSARYRIGGTLDDPEVKFVSVFDVTPADNRTAAEDKADATGKAAPSDAAPADRDGASAGGAPAPERAPQGRVPRDDAKQPYAEQRFAEQTGVPATHE